MADRPAAGPGAHPTADGPADVLLPTEPGAGASVDEDPRNGPHVSNTAAEESPPAGPRRLLIAFYAVFALAATARGIVQIATKFDEAPLAYLLSTFSGIVYVGATVGLVANRRWSRPLAWGAIGTEMVGVVTIGIASLVDSTAFPHDTVWSRFGSGYGYVPVILPVLGLMWLWQTRGAARVDPADR